MCATFFRQGVWSCFAGYARHMGDHPQRTPFYGTVMMLAAMISGLWVADLPWVALRVVAYLALLVVALTGFLMTFRDYS